MAGRRCRRQTVGHTLETTTMTRFQSAATLAALLTTTLMPAQAAVTLTQIAPASWGASNAVLGLSGSAVIEDFEDVTLVNGLQITSSGSSNGSYGPTGTLPRTFDPRPSALGGDDPYGNAFWSYPCGTGACSSLWDGSHALINTGTNGVAPYGGSTWADITLDMATLPVSAGGKMTQQRTPHSMRKNALSQLKGGLPRFRWQRSLCHLAGARGEQDGSDWILPLATDPDYAAMMVNPVMAPTYNRHYVVDGSDLIQGGQQLASVDTTDALILDHVDGLASLVEESRIRLQPVKIPGDPAAGHDPILGVLMLVSRLINQSPPANRDDEAA
jgi:hypothetical protein